MINAEEALLIILNSVPTLEPVTLALEHALGFALAEDIISLENIPSFDNSGMDGYAVRAEDVHQVPVTLKIAGEIAAGSVPQTVLRQGEAMSIMTGAPIPRGANAVVQIEWTEPADASGVKILRSVSQHHNIRRLGADIQQGANVLTRGSVLRPQEIGVLASLGKRFVKVYRKPEVAVLTTGNEVLDIDRPMVAGKVRNSNAYSLVASVGQTGCTAYNLGIAKDEQDDLQQKISEGLKKDLLITSGGISVGKYDLVMETLKALGVEIKFWKINIKPGMPLMFGLYAGKPVFALPGNPVSTLITFLQFVKPALMKMMGYQADNTRIMLCAMLEEEIKKTDGKRHFIRGVLSNNNGSLVVRTSGAQVSNILTSVTKANCLIIMREEEELIRSGEMVEIQLL